MQVFRSPALVSYPVRCFYGNNRQHYLLLGSPVTYYVSRGMAGHSKWANIKHTKAAMDAERMRKFQKFTRMMKVAIKEGGGVDPKLNSKLSKVIEIARSSSMPVVSIENVLKSGQKTQDNAKPYISEFRGPGGVFVIAELLTDNLNRAKHMIFAATKKFNFQEVKGSARHLFEEKGVIVGTSKDMSHEEAMDCAIEVGAEDVTEEEGKFTFTCATQDFLIVKRALEDQQIVIESADVEFLPNNPVDISDQDMEQLQTILQKLEDLDDVMKVHVNL